MSEKKTAMKGVREYAEEMDVELVEDADTIYIKAYNEAGYNVTHTDLHDLLKWVATHRPQIYNKYAKP